MPSLGGERDRRAPRRCRRASVPCTVHADPVDRRAGVRRRASPPTSPGAEPRRRSGRSRSRRSPPRTPASRRAGRAAPGTPGRRRACAPPGGPTAARARSAGPSSRSRSRTSALRWRLRITSPRCARRFSPALPLISSAWVMTLSRPSYWVIHLAAVFGPTPGHAGQVVGGPPPPAPRARGSAAGGTPYLASTAAGVIRASSETPRIG